MSKKNILIITPFAPPNIGGVETHIEDYYNYLAKKDYHTTVLTYQPLTSKTRGKSVEKLKNLTIRRYQWIGFNLFPTFEKLPPVFNFLYLTPYLLIRSFIFMLWNHQSIDVIHAFGLNSAFIARILKTIFRKRIVVSMEALYGFTLDNIFGKVCRWVFDGFDAILVGSEESKVDVLQLKIVPTKVIVYVHWIDLEHFVPGNKKKLKKKLGWKDSFTVIYIGRLIKSKGIEVFLETARKSDAGIQFKIVGDGLDAPLAEAASKKHANIDYIGRIPNDEVPVYYAAADVLLYPALYDEDLSLVLLESLACGTPVINTNKGSGIYKLHNNFSYVVKPDAAKMAIIIDDLFKNPNRLANMSQAGVNFAQQFGIELARIKTATYDND